MPRTRKWEIYPRRNRKTGKKEWWWRLRSTNGQKMAGSVEGLTKRAHAFDITHSINPHYPQFETNN